MSGSSPARWARIVAMHAADPVERTALILVGPALAPEGFRDSALYDAGLCAPLPRSGERRVTRHQRARPVE